jgi:hypothetical protein
MFNVDFQVFEISQISLSATYPGILSYIIQGKALCKSSLVHWIHFQVNAILIECLPFKLIIQTFWFPMTCVLYKQSHSHFIYIHNIMPIFYRV